LSYFSLLPHRCVTQRPVYGAVDSHGVPVKTFATLATGVHCRFEWQGKQENNVTVMDAVGTWKLFLPKAQDLLEDDRVVSITDKAGASIDAGPFDVAQVNSFTAYSKHHHKSCTLKRAEKGGTAW